MLPDFLGMRKRLDITGLILNDFDLAENILKGPIMANMQIVLDSIHAQSCLIPMCLPSKAHPPGLNEVDTGWAPSAVQFQLT